MSGGGKIFTLSLAYAVGGLVQSVEPGLHLLVFVIFVSIVLGMIFSGRGGNHE